MNEGPRSVPPPRQRSLADRVRRSRRRGFVGRASQCRIFEAALRGEPHSAQILLVHGIGGIGKSALLRRWAADARDAGRTVVWLDGEQVGVSISAFEKQAAAVHATERPVLFVDGFEHCRQLETWLREEFLPTVPEAALVVVAGRQRPDPQWTVDEGWRELVGRIELGPLMQDEVVALLDDRGVVRARQPAVHGFAGGHPLALCLAAAAANEDASFDGALWTPDALWTPGPDVVLTMLRQLIDRAPSPAHLYGLRVCGHVRHTTLEMLRTGLDEDAALTVFDWLAGLPYVEPRQEGLLAHELVRDVLDADFAWRDPEKYTELHLRLWRCLGDRARAAAGDAIEPAVADLLYLLRHRSAGRELFDAPDTGPLVERAYTPELRADLLRMTHEDQGAEQARLLDHWLRRYPGAFHTYCRAGDLRPVSVCAWLRLRPDRDDFTADPVLLPIRDYLDQHPLADTDDIGIARFLVPAPVADRYTTGSALHIARMSVQNMRRHDGLAAIFLLLPALESFLFKMELFGYSVLCRLPDLSGRSWVVLVRDWRALPASSPLVRVTPAAESAPGAPPDRRPEPAPGPVPAPGSGLSRQQHDHAVRRALRDWHDDEAIAANPLAGARELLREAIAALGADPGRVKHQRVVRMTYLERTTSQEATAAHLNIPFSTYRRYLTAGVQQLCDHLWQRGDPVPQWRRSG